MSFQDRDCVPWSLFLSAIDSPCDLWKLTFPFLFLDFPGLKTGADYSTSLCFPGWFLPVFKKASLAEKRLTFFDCMTVSGQSLSD